MHFTLRKRSVIVLLAVVMALMLIPLAASASIVSYGSLSSAINGGITATKELGSGQLSIAWSINDDEPAINGLKVFDYTYTITETKSADIKLVDFSHIIFQISSTITPSNVAANIFDFTPAANTYYPGDPKTYSVSNSNPSMPASIYGLKFTASNFPAVKNQTNTFWVYTMNFDSMRAPVDGSFYIKGGGSADKAATAWNTGLVGGTAFIQVPDSTVTAIPIPGSVLLLGSGLVGMGLLRLRRRQNKS